MYRRTERPSADRRGRSGPTYSLVPAARNVKRPQPAPAGQLRQQRKMRNFSFWKPSKLCLRVLDADNPTPCPQLAKAVLEVTWQAAVPGPVRKPLPHRSGALGLMEPAAESWPGGTVLVQG